MKGYIIIELGSDEIHDLDLEDALQLASNQGKENELLQATENGDSIEDALKALGIIE